MSKTQNGNDLTIFMNILLLCFMLYAVLFLIIEVCKEALLKWRILMAWKEEKIAEWHAFLAWKDEIIRYWSGEPETARRNRGQRVRDTNLREDQRCVVCRENPREIILLRCGHVCLCEDCSDNINSECPICRAPITQRYRAYIS